LKVIHIVGGRPHPDALNGVEAATYHMARAQARLGMDVTVFALTHTPALAVDGVETRTFSTYGWRFRPAKGIIAALEASGPDVLHLHSPYFPEHVPVTRWARRRRVPYVVTPHGALSPGELALRWAVKLPYKYLFERAILNGAAFVHSLGSHEQLKRYGVTVPVVFVPNGVNLPELATTYRRPLSERHPEIAGRTIFLVVGRLEPVQKGLDLLIAAIARTGRSDIALVLAGPDYQHRRRRLVRLVNRARSAAPIVLSAPLVGREKTAALAEADVFANTSRWEGMPHAVLEAAAQARPLLLTAVVDPWERLRQMNAAVLVEPTIDGIAGGLDRICNTAPHELAEMGTRAQRLVRAEFTWDRTASELRDAYVRYALRSPKASHLVPSS
jgi:glycosyltransferase involved in cell wall biosynthesis